MKYLLILIIAVLGIFSTVYIVKKPLDHYAKPPISQQTLDEWRVKLEYEKKQLQLLNAWNQCGKAGGWLYIENDNSVCVLRKGRWN